MNLWYCWDLVVHAGQSAHNFFFDAPLRRLYFYGPEIAVAAIGGVKISFGFWKGLPLPEICALQTGVPSPHWSTHGRIECDELAERQYQSFYTAVCAAAYVICLYKAMSMGMHILASRAAHSHVVRELQLLRTTLGTPLRQCDQAEG